MDQLKLVYWPDKSLNERSNDIIIFSPFLNEMAAKMSEVMQKENGIGIAAVQVGEPVRLFIAVTQKHGPVVIINPRIETWGEELYEDEGCLSLPDGWGPVSRQRYARLTGTSMEGQVGSLDFEGYDARIIQHEYDHLEGKLFSEYLSSAHRSKVFDAVRRYKRKQRHDPRRVPKLRGGNRAGETVSLVQPATLEETKKLIER